MYINITYTNIDSILTSEKRKLKYTIFNTVLHFYILLYTKNKKNNLKYKTIIW